MGESYPRPGPCRNDRLVELQVNDDEDADDDRTLNRDVSITAWMGSPLRGGAQAPKKWNGTWVARQGMQMAVRSRKGDYRRVSADCWKAIKECYPGSGPDIEMVYNYDEKLADTGVYDITTWKITPDDHMFDVNKRKKKKNIKKMMSLKSLQHMGASLRHMGNTPDINNEENAEPNTAANTTANSRLLSTDSDTAGPRGFDDAHHDSTNSNDPILPGANRDADSDDDDEARPYDTLAGSPDKTKGEVSANCSFVCVHISSCQFVPLFCFFYLCVCVLCLASAGINPMKKVMMARTFLGSNASNDSAKEGTSPSTRPAYSKVSTFSCSFHIIDHSTKHCKITGRYRVHRAM